MKSGLALLIILWWAWSDGCCADETWEFRGEFVRLTSDGTEVVVVRLGDGRTIELPLECLTESSRSAARRAGVAARSIAPGEGSGGAVAVPGPLGRPVRVSVPEGIKDVEADAIRCRTALDAADVYRLYLAGDAITAEQRSMAAERLREWITKSEKGLVRCGERWIPKAESEAIATEAGKVVEHAIELMRLGNAHLAEDELLKASRLDPGSGRPHFIMGLSYALIARNFTKAVEQFGEVVLREPDNAAALNNLAVLEILGRRYGSVAGHFGDALAWAADRQPIADNLCWAVRLAGAAESNPALAKNKIPEKALSGLNSLYRTLTQDLGLRPADSISNPVFVAADGRVCTATNLADIGRACDEAMGDASAGYSLGIVVGTHDVVCPKRVLVADDGAMHDVVSIESPASPGERWSAEVVAVPEAGDVALLRCGSLVMEPLPLATEMPGDAEVTVVDRDVDSWLRPRLAHFQGRVVVPAVQGSSDGGFVHTAVVPRGLGGGPVVDGTGRVIGMVKPTPRTDLSGNAAGMGVSVAAIRDALGKRLATAAPSRLPASAGAGSVGDRALKGTVVVRASRIVSAPQAAAAKESQ